jgi:hypothetical protein
MTTQSISNIRQPPSITLHILSTNAVIWTPHDVVENSDQQAGEDGSSRALSQARTCSLATNSIVALTNKTLRLFSVACAWQSCIANCLTLCVRYLIVESVPSSLRSPIRTTPASHQYQDSLKGIYHPIARLYRSRRARAWSGHHFKCGEKCSNASRIHLSRI